MDYQNYLEFSADGKEVTLHTGDKESLAMYSKEEVFQALLKQAQKQKISPADFTRMRNEALAAKDLLFSEEEAVAACKHVSPRGYHKHKCDNCGYVWEHSNSCFKDDNAHTCPKCREEQWDQHFGPEVPATTTAPA